MMKQAILAAALAAAPLAANAATLVFSDDFEAPNNTQNWQVYQNFGSWATTSGSGIEIQTTETVPGVSANSGDQYVELDSDNERGGLPDQPKNSSMTTKLNLNAGTYLVEWFYQPRTSTAGDNTIGVYIAGATEGLFANLIGAENSVRSSSTDWVKVIY